MHGPVGICNVCLVPCTPCAVDGTLIVDCTCIAPVPVYTPPPSTIAQKYTDKKQDLGDAVAYNKTVIMIDQYKTKNKTKNAH